MDLHEGLLETGNQYKGRAWLTVFLFTFGGFANALILLSFAPIAGKAQDYWNTSATLVNLLAVSFQIMYIPGSTLLVRMMRGGDLRKVVLVAGILQTVGCGIRLGAAGINHVSGQETFSYAVMLIGTAVAATAQPFYLNLPANVASAWFGVKDRDIATTVCALANPLGSAIGAVLPTLLVKGGTDDDPTTEDKGVTGIWLLCLVQLLVATTSVALVFFMYESRPPTPPSQSEKEVMERSEKNRKNAEGMEVQRVERTSSSGTRGELSQLSQHGNFVKLFVGFVLVLGHLNALAALIGQLPGEYSDNQYGTLGAVLIMSGFTGAFVAGLVLERTKAYSQVLKFAYCASLLAWTFFLSMCSDNNFGPLTASAGLLGFSLLPIVPASIVNAVETVFPISGEVAVSVLYVGANTLAIPLTFIGQALLEMDSFGHAPLFPYALWVVSTFSIGLISVMLYEGHYMRLLQDEEIEKNLFNDDNEYRHTDSSREQLPPQMVVRGGKDGEWSPIASGGGII
jgi:hypothetical protein